MKKTELIEALFKAVTAEEGASADFLSYIASITRDCGLGEQELAMVQARINYLVAANNCHRQIVLEEMARIKEKPGDEI